ncbi:MAG: DUF4097 family beta strand repeat protein [Clostridia bacterium]|nr:DUF4097 family beta strand repeat protein [Clostridia bacterium]
MEKRLKRVAVITAIVMGALLLFAIVLGVLNALVADGRWSFGWKDYRYDEEGYESGQGSIPSSAITKIDLDWIDGGVEIVSCQDAYISLSETANTALPDSAELRWKVDADGTLYVKYRQSDWFFGIGSDNREKQLTLRIPESYFAQLNEIEIKVSSSNVVIRNVTAKALEFESVSGALVVQGCDFSTFSAESKKGKLVADGLLSSDVSVEASEGDVDFKFPNCPTELEISSTYGSVTLRLPQNASFALAWETKKGSLSHDLPLTQSGNRYIAGEGSADFEVKTTSGNLTLTVIE